MRYMIIVKGDERVESGAMPRESEIQAMADYHEALEQAGVLVGASGLQPTARGFRVRYQNDKRVVMDGPFAETKELIAGYTIINVSSHEEAVEWARRFPNPKGEGIPCEIEVRLMFELEDFEQTEAIDRMRRINVGNS
ncbi:YciI family protein [Natronospira bacteriovora]|uniref:YciI family protein n=1 Tax=Natronospira bacteriovora TaxID=3069753 RepID=A0ABU0W5Q1_9GAMM|nr:YciI family protein [Natronospira sp. AB-CW4]MDQ2068785.1 YciI family protein [Natronospira sp. AB-CW4]